MNRFVLDASVVLTWCFPDENSDFARKVAEQLGKGQSAVVPTFWAHEVLNALLVGEKRKRISRELLQSFLSDLKTMPIETQGVPIHDVFGHTQELSLKHQLTAYDAAYLYLAEMNNLPLATLDADLIAASRRSGVALLSA